MKKTKSTFISLVVITILSIAFIFFGNRYCSYNSTTTVNEEANTATVLSIVSKVTEPQYMDFNTTTIVFTAKITSGDDKNTVVTATQTLDDMLLPLPKEVSKGDKILLLDQRYIAEEPEEEWVYVSHNRFIFLVFILIAFLILI